MRDETSISRLARRALGLVAAGAVVAVFAASGVDVIGTPVAAPADPATPAATVDAVTAAPLEVNNVVVVEPPAAPTNKLESMTGQSAPQPRDLGKFVKNADMVVALGKALFWDRSVGSDGKTACASCHFHAGVDNRIKNQIHPGADAALLAQPFQIGRPNHLLALADFPTYVLSNPNDRDSVQLKNTDDIVGSQGVFDKDMAQAGKRRVDRCLKVADPVFHVGAVSTRRVTGRNAPSVINAVFNVRNFWDGRANYIFNGSNPFGARDPDAGVWRAEADGTLTPVKIALEDSSAASQAVGPPNSGVEMACGGRVFAEIGQRLLDNFILVNQAISPDDSVLAPQLLPGDIRPRYQKLVRQGFKDDWWKSPASVTIGGVAYSQMEANFALFFGLAIQMYEATLVSDQTRLDAYLNGNGSALNSQELLGMSVFTGKGHCINCHNGPELTGAGTPLRRSLHEITERMLMGDGKVALYDSGFYNIGVRPTAEDIGVGGLDPWGNPLSFSRQYLSMLDGKSPVDSLVRQVEPCKWAVPVSTDPAQCADQTLLSALRSGRVAVDGAFKVPGLRNIELTGPYFHNGSRATLEQVVEFYNRGGDRRGDKAVNSSGLGVNGSNLDPDIEPLGLSADEKAGLVAFLKTLTDERVRWERKPFDHPQLQLPEGHVGDEWAVASAASGNPNRPLDAQDEKRIVKAVGAGGRTAKEGPLQAFSAQLK